MSILKIAWRSIQHRGFGSFLTIFSMALGVMLVVSVLSIHGLVTDFFRSNSSFGYNILVGARGGPLQLTMNTVFYLSQPVENVPYEYYLAFCNKEQRNREMQYSFAAKTCEQELAALQFCQTAGNPGIAQLLAQELTVQVWKTEYEHRTGIERDGIYRKYTDVAIPLCLGDSYEIEGSETYFRCVGTSPNFFDELVLDVDTEEKFTFAEGQAFKWKSEENGFFECVLGALVAQKSGLKIGDTLYPTHGDPNDSTSRIHAEGFKVVGILEGTRTPHDRAVFLNMEGFFLMEDHAKPVEDERVTEEATDPADVDPFADEEDDEDSESDADEGANREPTQDTVTKSNSTAEVTPLMDVSDPEYRKSPLPMEQREVTSILIRTSKEDEWGLFAYVLPQKIDEGTLEETLSWSNFRPVLAQKAAQAVNPITEVTKFLGQFVGPIQMLLLALTTMICVVSGISILVGIYNSMIQRKHEIAVMRALGASRSKVMSIMLVESMMLACTGGLIGWIAGHLLNVGISPFVESRTGVGIGFFDLAPPIPVFGILNGLAQDLLGLTMFPEFLINMNLSPELLLIPGLIILSVLVGIYPAITAYRTDVARSLGK